jgi:hypothetical protein
MSKGTSTMIVTVVALLLSGGAYAQANNTLATPTTRSPADATTGYGAPGATQSDSGAGSMNASQTNRMGMAQTSVTTPAFGSNNTLATPTTKSPVSQ